MQVVGHLGAGGQTSVGIFLGINVAPVSALDHGVAVIGSVEMELFVAHQTDSKHGTVRLFHLDFTWVGRNSHCHAGGQHGNGKK